ncbi:7625_t:CDS:2, partial [Racocetra persica]
SDKLLDLFDCLVQNSSSTFSFEPDDKDIEEKFESVMVTSKKVEEKCQILP